MVDCGSPPGECLVMLVRRVRSRPNGGSPDAQDIREHGAGSRAADEEAEGFDGVIALTSVAT